MEEKQHENFSVKRQPKAAGQYKENGYCLFRGRGIRRASPIYYHGISGQLKCAVDRFYSAAYPQKPSNLKKIAMLLSSGDANMYDGALFSYRGDFLDYLGLKDMGIFTAYGYENGSDKKLKEIRAFGAGLK